MLRALYRFHFQDARRERAWLASIGFLVAFVAIRAVTHAIRAEIGPFHDVSIGGRHVHHLVAGIMLLLGVSYLWLLQLGTDPASRWGWLSPVTALLYEIGRASCRERV